VLAVLLVILPSCQTFHFYGQAIDGQFEILRKSRSNTRVIADPLTAPDLRRKLLAVEKIREFASTHLSLPGDESYGNYADLGRKHVVWVLYAAPEFSLTPKTWHYPAVGEMDYRGYFREQDSLALARQLRADGYDVFIGGVDAYSTLGWMNWAGGDPLLSTFISYPEGELARLIFHELAHQVAYAAGDTTFNESFATAVERLGIQRWLETQASETARQDYAALDKRRREFRALALTTRSHLTAIYPSKEAVALEKRTLPATVLIAKERIMQRFRADYAQLKTTWGGFSGYDPWVVRANNASLGAQAAYDELVPGFEALFEREGRDWQRFYAAVKLLANAPQDERHKALKTKTTENLNG